MAFIGLGAGFAVFVMGAAWATKGMLLVISRRKIPTLVVGLLLFLFGSVCPGIVLAASAAAEGQTSFAAALLIAAGVWDAVLLCGMLSAARPFLIYHPVLVREMPFLLAALIYLAAACRDVFLPGHPCAVLGKGSGIFLLILFLLEIFVLFGSSMKGYRLRRSKVSWPLFPAFLWTGLGGCCLFAGAFLTGQTLTGVSNLLGLHPALLGLGAGVLISFFYIKRITAEWKLRGNKVFPAVFGPASLTFTGGFGAICMVSEVSVTYEIEILMICGIALFSAVWIFSFMGKRLGRVRGVLLIAGCLITAALFVLRLAPQIFTGSF